MESTGVTVKMNGNVLVSDDRGGDISVALALAFSH